MPPPGPVAFMSQSGAMGVTIAAKLLAAGVDPEEMYRRVYASVPLGRLQLLRDALETLEVDVERGLAWISVPAGAVDLMFDVVDPVLAEDADLALALLLPGLVFLLASTSVSARFRGHPGVSPHLPSKRRR
mgnify:CR=1 FL=1